MKKTASILGLGRIGKMIAKLLLGYGAIGEIRIYSRAKKTGYIEEMNHINDYGAKIRQVDTVDELCGANYIFISLSMDYSGLVFGREVEDEWSIELESNLNSLRPLLPRLSRTQNSIFFVYTNPVDVLSRVLYESIHPSNRVYGFGSSLDTLRLRNVVGKPGIVIGEHGTSMVPVGVSKDRRVIVDARERIIRSMSIVTTHEGYTSLGPEIATRNFLDALLGNRPETLSLSAYNEAEDIFIGSVFEVKNEAFRQCLPELNDAERELWGESVLKIRKNLERAEL